MLIPDHKRHPARFMFTVAAGMIGMIWLTLSLFEFLGGLLCP